MERRSKSADILTDLAAALGFKDETAFSNLQSNVGDFDVARFCLMIFY
jgi:hypothetical protein